MTFLSSVHQSSRLKYSPDVIECHVAMCDMIILLANCFPQLFFKQVPLKINLFLRLGIGDSFRGTYKLLLTMNEWLKRTLKFQSLEACSYTSVAFESTTKNIFQ